MKELFFFLIAITIIVSIHELGHYVVARIFAVKVKRFSVGFGKVLLSRTIRGTEWCISMIPLGGYVSMLDTRIDKVTEQEKQYAFNLKHPFKKILIYLAGPLVNLGLGIFLFTFIFYTNGVVSIKPQVNTVIPHSLAEQAGFQEGDFILAVNDVAVTDMSQVELKVVANLEQNNLTFKVKDVTNNIQIRQIDTTHHEAEVNNIIQGKSSFGILADKVTNQLGQVIKNSPADKAGLKENDIIVAVNDQLIDSFFDFSELIKRSPGKPLQINYIRDEKNYSTVAIPESIELNRDTRLVGRLGVGNKVEETIAKQNRVIYYLSFQNSVRMAVERTVTICDITLRFLGKMLIGKSSLMHLNGPFTTASYAGKTAEIGLQAYLMFLALISISIGILNLLPIPMLDGGGVVYSLIEWIRGKPLSEKVQEFGLRLGFTIIMMLMFIAFFNDFTRMFG